MSSPPQSPSASRRLLAPLFFCSGAAALGFEVVWARQLATVLGGSTTGVAYVVSLFMGGMAIGYSLGGRLSRRVRRPVQGYGLAELGVACFGLVAVWLVPQLEPVAGTALAWLASAALILPCTILAGVTLPLLMEATRGPLGGSIGWLYGVNTAGAVIGVLVAGLFLIGQFGLRTTGMLLFGFGVLIGGVALVAGRDIGRSAPARATAGSSPRGSSFWLVIAAMVGAASLAEEVLWTRALLPHLSSTTYAFTIILAVFLCGLALGAAAAGYALRRCPAWSSRALVGTQIAVGVLVLFSPELLALAEQLVTGYVGVRRATGFSLWLGTVGVSLARGAAALLLPTFLLGLALPLTAQLYAGDAQERGVATGWVTASNTGGAVVGALAARFVLLPVMGTGGSLQAAACLHALIALAVALRHRERWRPWVITAALVAAALVAASLFRPPATPFLGRLVARRAGQILMVDEGVQDTTVVAELRGAPTGARLIFSNGIGYSGDTPGAKQYMRLLGHLPALWAREQERALVICIGTGMTAAAVARHPNFARIDLVDISPAVHKTLPYFERSNDSVWTSSRIRTIIEDGRVFIARSAPNSYDVITLEPPPPRSAGMSALYSREFYQRSRALLRDGGAMAQWLPLHGLTDDELALLTRTFLEVFPDTALVMLSPYEAALIATRGAGSNDAERSRRAALPPVAEHLVEMGVPDPSALPIIAGSKLVAAIGEGPVVTDDHPRNEHFASRLAWDAGNDNVQRERFLVRLFGGQ